VEVIGIVYHDIKVGDIWYINNKIPEKILPKRNQLWEAGLEVTLAIYIIIFILIFI